MVKCGAMLKVIICALLIRVLGGRKVVPIGQLRGDNLVPTFQICYHVELAFSSFTLASILATTGQFIMVPNCSTGPLKCKTKLYLKIYWFGLCENAWFPW